MAAVSKEEYLKRYLSNADSGEKKKRKKKVKTGIKTGMSCIIDDDVNLSDIKVKRDSEVAESLLELADETPLIFNETGTTVLSKDLESIKRKEDEKNAMWAPLGHFQEEISTDLSPVRSKVRISRHDSLSPERGSINEKLTTSSKIEKQVNSTKVYRQRHTLEDLSPRQRTRYDSSPDQSPPRQKTKKLQSKATRYDSPNLSPEIQRTRPPTDQSPPRRTRHDSSSDQSSPRNRQNFSKMVSKASRNNSANVLSVRNNRNARSRSPVDQSPPRRTRHDSSPDQSPPRNRRPPVNQPRMTRHESPDMSPPRRMGNNRPASLDQSPRRRNRRNSSSDQSPPRNTRPSANLAKRTRHDSPDLSPPRRKANNRSVLSDQLPPRKQRTVDNKNQISNRRRRDSPDLSPPRNTRGSSPDQSPPRKQGGQSGKRSFKGGRDDGHSSDQSPPRKQKNSERKAGLHSGVELRQENERTRQRENEMFARMSSSTTGKGAGTVHRDKTGRKRDFKVEEAKKKEDERKKQEENETFMEWGKGVQQTKSTKQKVDDDLYEMSKPLARYKNDEDLDKMLRDRERAEDPMLAFMQKQKAKQDVIAGKKEKPKYRGPAPPPNRFNIPPGYRWDGVDRSNGFEKKRFSMLANKGATREEAYKWSTEDM
ncbi:Hypothetical predicted protein [Paramuricea clavata]|nr:Hypothetical predicted protein [Paramuricea clavata]